MEIEVVEKDGLKRELKVEVPSDLVDREYQRIYNELRQKANIKGFRPGKAPLNVIRSKFKNEATGELIDQMVRKYYEEAVREKSLEPVGPPTLTDLNVDEGKPLKFTMGIEVMPQIDTITFDGLATDESEVTVEDSEVEAVLEELRKSQASLRTVDRPATENDVLICDLEVAEGDTEIFDETYYQNQEIDLNGEYTDKEFVKALIGASRDDMREVEINYGHDYPNPRFAGKRVVYRVTVNEIKERVLPALTDEFAKQSGQAETLLELKLDIRTQLEKEAKVKRTKDNRKSLIEQLIEKNKIMVPETMLESYFHNLLEEQKRHNPNTDIDEQQLRDKHRENGEKAIRWYLLFHRLALQEKLEVGPSDIEQWIKEFAQMYHLEVDKAKEVLAQSGKATDIRDGILEEKVLDFLSGHATGSQEKTSD